MSQQSVTPRNTSTYTTLERPNLADRPIPAHRLALDTYVYVPVWREGRVVDWDNGRVIAIQGSIEDRNYIVRPDTAPEALYLGHEITCGVCMGRDDIGCWQCRPTRKHLTRYITFGPEDVDWRERNVANGTNCCWGCTEDVAATACQLHGNS